MGIRVAVPDVMGLNLDAAKQKIKDTGFEVANLPTAVFSLSAKDTVVGTTPGGQVLPGSIITVNISNGIAPAPPPPPMGAPVPQGPVYQAPSPRYDPGYNNNYNTNYNDGGGYNGGYNEAPTGPPPELAPEGGNVVEIPGLPPISIPGMPEAPPPPFWEPPPPPPPPAWEPPPPPPPPVWEPPPPPPPPVDIPPQ